MNIETLIINLPSRKDRQAHIVEEVKKLPNLKCSIVEGIVDETKTCFQSHKKCIQLAKDRKLEYVLVLEDDAVFVEGAQQLFIKNFKEIQNYSWDMYYLGANLHRPAQKISDSILKLTGAWCTHAYMVHSRFYDVILKLPSGKEIDVCYTELMQDYNIYMCNPMIAYQLPSYSDLQNGFRDYNQAIKTNYINYT